ncbi:MAG: hypothetical protein ACK4NX_02195, partial [Candidatus Paceibacteria bacterium]
EESNLKEAYKLLRLAKGLDKATIMAKNVLSARTQTQEGFICIYTFGIAFMFVGTWLTYYILSHRIVAQHSAKQKPNVFKNKKKQ